MPKPFTVTATVSDEDVASMLCSAFEGGSNYWYRIEKFFKTKAPLSYRTDPDIIYRHIDYPMSQGCYLLISSYEEPKRKHERLDRAAIQRGLDLMAEKYPHHYENVIGENADAETGDVLLQLALYGDIIYG
jgi:hypothetical protein